MHESLGQLAGVLLARRGLRGAMLVGPIRSCRLRLDGLRAESLGQLPGAQRAQLSQQVRRALHPGGPVAFARALQAGQGLRQYRRIQQLAQPGRAQKLREHGRIQGQGGGAALGGGRIRVVEVLGHVLEEQGAGEGRGSLGLHLHEGDAARLQSAVHL